MPEIAELSAVLTENVTSQLRGLDKVTVKLSIPALSSTVTSLIERVGGLVSVIVTVASHVETFPELSVTDNVTILGPTSEQLKEVLEASNDCIPQLSVLLELMSEAVMVAEPAVLRFTVMFLQLATGFSLSIIVTEKLHVANPQTLEAVNTTLVTPVLKTEPLPVPAPLPEVAPEKT